MPRGYTLSPEAQQDIREIRAFYVEDSGPRTARYVLAEITRTLRFLARRPGAGHSRTDLTTSPVKFWPVFSYVVVYDPALRPIGVARVLHGSRDLVSLFAARPPLI